MRALLLTCLLLAVATPTLSQAPPVTPPSQMQAVGWLIGRWVGTATMRGPRGTDTLEQRELVESRLGGGLLVIEGTGRRLVPGRAPEVVFSAVATISYGRGASGEGWRIRSHLPNGLMTDGSIEVRGDSIIWGYEHPQAGRVRYTIARTTAGEWHEIGDATRDNGATWFRFLEMRLRQEP